MNKQPFILIFWLLIAKSLPMYPQQTTVDTLSIATAEELKAFSRHVNNGNNYRGKVVQLTQDIFLNDTTAWQQWDSVPQGKKEQWNPIGHIIDTDSIVAFQGTFEGNGHCIYGLYINRRKTGVFQGLFGVVKNATVKNLTIKASVITGYLYTGGIVAYLIGRSTINNCHNFGKIIAARNQVGGIAAFLNAEASAAIVNCSNSGTLKGKSIIGGIVGLVYIDNEESKKGRNKICGIAIYNCFNRGTIEGYKDIGGIIGYHSVQAHINRTDTIANCYNVGNILSQYVAGGICGTYFSFQYRDRDRRIDSYCKPSFSNCYNTGTISINYSTATDFIIGSLFCMNSELAKIMAKNSVPCYYTMQTGVILPHERVLVTSPHALFIALHPSTRHISSPSHFHALTPEEMRSDSFVDKLNVFVTEHPGPYKKWKKDTENRNGGFPVFEE